jgi:hypothetical protein
MGFRFRRSVSLFPGMRINLSKSGPSVSLGGGGATLNLSKRGTRATFGIRGTGISYQVSSSSGGRHKPTAQPFANSVSIPGGQSSARTRSPSIFVRAIIGCGVLAFLVHLLAGGDPSKPDATFSTPLPADAAIMHAPGAADPGRSGSTSDVQSSADGSADGSAEALAVSSATGGSVTILRTANLRSGPGTQNAILRVGQKGETLTVITRTQGWVEVQDSSTTAWIAQSLVR